MSVHKKVQKGNLHMPDAHLSCPALSFFQLLQDILHYIFPVWFLIILFNLREINRRFLKNCLFFQQTQPKIQQEKAC